MRSPVWPQGQDGLAVAMSDNAHSLAEAARLAEILGGTAIGLIGGTVATTIATVFPPRAVPQGYLVHLLFIPAWFLLGLSIYHGFEAQTVYLGELFSKANLCRPVIMSRILNSQIDYFGYALSVLALWLLAMVIERALALRTPR